MLGMLEKIINSLLFHQPANKAEICLTVLDTIFPVLVWALKLEVAIKTFQHIFENVRHGFLLKYPALQATGKKPDFRNDLRIITSEFLITIPLGKGGTDSAKVSPFVCFALSRSGYADHNVVPYDPAEIDCR